MIKRGPAVVAPAEFLHELSIAMRQIGELAVALRIPRPDWLDDYDRLDEHAKKDQWVMSRGRIELIDEAWNAIAAEFVVQALATGNVAPGSSDPSS